MADEELQAQRDEEKGEAEAIKAALAFIDEAPRD
jgi:hypothetical protein